MKKIYTIVSPQMFPLFQESTIGNQVVVIDILRATTSMVMMLENGAIEVYPVANLDEALAFDESVYLRAGERNGLKVEGFTFGNSPQEFTKDAVEGKKLVITTTNGTRALKLSEGAARVLVGAFLNLNATAKFLNQSDNDVFLFCAGWKGHFNLEDTVFAGAMCEQLISLGYSMDDDASRAAKLIWDCAKSDLARFLESASHVHRFRSIHAESDLAACLKIDTSNSIVSYQNGILVLNRL